MMPGVFENLSASLWPCLLVTAIAGGPAGPAAAAAAKPLVYCADASPEGFDPGLWDSASTNIVNSQMFDGLLGFKRPTTELQPKLATSWEISPDAKSFTFKLRPGVKFQSTPWFKPTRDFNADDVVFTFSRFIDPSHPFNKDFPAVFVYPQNLGLAKLIGGIGLHFLPGTQAWWLARIPWFAALTAGMVLLLPLVGRFERASPPPTGFRPSTLRILTGAALVSAGIAFLTLGGIAAEGAIGVRGIVVGGTIVGAWLLGAIGPGKPGDRQRVPA